MYKRIKNLLADKSGERFKHTHEEFKRTLFGRSFVTVFMAILGIFLCLFGFVLLFIPGPGLLVILLGLMFISSVSFTIANALDKYEVILVKKYQALRDVFKRKE